VRAVIDNNLLVSGLLWSGKPGRLLQAVAEGGVQLFLSEQLLAELREVLHREKFAARMALKGTTPEMVLGKVQAAARVVPAPAIPMPLRLRNPDDVHVLACAVGAGADAIVTGDKDLLIYAVFRGHSDHGRCGSVKASGVFVIHGVLESAVIHRGICGIRGSAYPESPSSRSRLSSCSHSARRC